MSGLLHIESVRVPIACVESVYHHLQAMGDKGLEGVALWSGRIKDRTFEVQTTIIPAQMAGQLENGLLYAVDGEELHRINHWLYQHKQTLVAQLHSHPGEAYHSEMDNRYPIIAVFGGVSIVIPDFGFNAFSLDDWAVYRLSPEKVWAELSPSDIRSLIQITP
jgi:proteasome lid subunit RPN8/RPN11